MTVLMCHNYYRDRGGEDQSFEDEVAMLCDAGVGVVTHVRHNDTLEDGALAGLRVAAGAVHSRASWREIGALMDRHRPDIVHCNNLFPQISSSVYGAAAERGIPVVQALRNYRYLCAAGSFYRDGKICLSCFKAPAAFAGVLHGCYRGSRAASAAVAALQLSRLLQDPAARANTLFLSPSAFTRNLFVEAGFDPSGIVVKQNFVHPDLGPAAGTSDRFVYVGRLAEEKGIRTLLDAWRRLPFPLDLYGDGPLRPLVEAVAAEVPTVTLHGCRPHFEVLDALGDARALVMPSEWYETFGRSAAEAYSRGTPVIASDLGALAELVDCGGTGCLVPPADPAALAAAVCEIAGMAEAPYRALRGRARAAFAARYSRAVNEDLLLGIYDRALGRTLRPAPDRALPEPEAARAD